MAYTDEQKREFIEEIQNFLRKISYMNDAVPLVAIDGIYGLETENSIVAFQKEYGIPITGTVNYQTYKKLVEQYTKAINMLKIEPIAVLPLPSHTFPLRIGNKNNYITIIQSMLNTIGKNYINFIFPDITGDFDDVTEKSVIEFQRFADLNQTGEVDKKTWDMLSKVYSVHIYENS